MTKPADPLVRPEGSRQTLRVEISTRSMLVAVLIAAALWLSYKLAIVFLVIVASLLVAGTLNPMVDWLERHKVGRGFGIGLVFAALVLVTLAAAALTLPSLVTQVEKVVDDWPAISSQITRELSKSRLTAPLADQLQAMRTDDASHKIAEKAVSYSSAAAEIVAYGVSAIFLALYLMIDRERVRGTLFALVPRTHHIRLSRVLLNLEVIVGGYIRGQVITSALMAAFVFALLTLCKVPNALAIGVFAGIADVLPYVGVFLSIGPALVAALPRGTTITLVILGVLLAYEEFESRILVPRIYGRALRLPSSVVMVALLAGGTLLGIIGALLALPLAAAIRMLVQELRVELPGEDLDEEPQRARDERAEHEYAVRAEGVPAEDAAAIAVEISDERMKEEAEEKREAEKAPATKEE